MHKNNSNLLPEHSSTKQLADDFGYFFNRKVDKIREQFSNDDSAAFQYDIPFEGVPLASFTSISVDDLKAIFSKLASKTCELDPIPTDLVKTCFDELSDIILSIVNLSLTSGCVPEALKTALIRPLLKKHNLEHVHKNYRPVSNLSFLSKVIEEAVNRQLNKHLNSNKLFEELQSAYRPFCSTETALIKVLSDALHHLDNRQAVLVALLDLSAAFDTVDHNILIRRLQNTFGINGSALAWFDSYLRGRSFKVVIQDALSDAFHLACSVPQGSILGPRLYTQYTKFLGTLVRMLLLCFHGYADDTQLLKAVSPRSLDDQLDGMKVLENGVVKISDSLFDNKLKLNRDKTEFLVLSSRYNRKFLNLDSIDLGTDIVSRSECARNLGFIIDSTLAFEQQILDVRKKCFYYLNWIKSVRPFLSDYAAKTIVHALVINRLDYCNSLYYGLPKKFIKQLQSIMNFAARVITNISREESVTIACKNLHWLPIEHRIRFKLCVMVFKCLHGQGPSYLNDMLMTHVPPRQLRSSHSNLLVIPKTNSKYGERSFSHAGAREWNAIPSSIRNIKTLNGFKRDLKTFFFKQAYKNIK